MRILEEEKTIFDKAIEIEKEHKKAYENIKDYYEKNKSWPDIDTVAKWIAENHYEEFGVKGDDYYEGLMELEKKLKGE